MEVFTNSAEAKLPEPGLTIHDFSLLALRGIVATAMVYFQGWAQIKQASAFVWEKAEWPLVAQFEALSLPAPTVLAPLMAALLILVPLGLVLGFLTRIIALIGFTMCIFLLFTQLDLSPTLNSQTLVLYGSVLLVMAFSGAGRLSLDALLTRRRKSD